MVKYYSCKRKTILPSFIVAREYFLYVLSPLYGIMQHKCKGKIIKGFVGGSC